MCPTCYKTQSASHNTQFHSGQNLFVLVTETFDVTMKYILSAKNTCELMMRSFAKYKDRPFIGQRMYDAKTKDYAATLTWYTFTQVENMVKGLASGMSTYIKPRAFVGICSANRVESTVAEFACLYRSYVSVPIQHTMMQQDMEHIVQNSDVQLIVCSEEYTASFVDAASMYYKLLTRVERCPTLKYLIQMEHPTHEQILHARKAGLTLLSFAEVESQGKGFFKMKKPKPTNPDEIVTLMHTRYVYRSQSYSSGSTGVPKGAIFNESHWWKEWSTLTREWITPLIMIAYLYVRFAT